MAFAQGSRSNLCYVVESTFGTTPGSPSMVDIPHNAHSLELTKASLESAEIRSDRQISNFRHGNRQIGGDIDVDFRAADYDDLLESAFFGEITTAGVLKVGTTPKFMSIEDQQLDIGKYRLFKGCAVNMMSMSVKPNAIVTAKFGVVGKDITISGTPADASVTAGAGYAPFDSFSGTISEGGSSIATVTSLDFQIDNSMQATFVIGSPTTPQLEYGKAKVSGTIQAYFDDVTLLNKFVNETESSLQFSLTDGITGHGYTFLFPKIKYTGANAPVQNEQSRTVSLPFIALYNVSDATNLKLTKA